MSLKQDKGISSNSLWFNSRSAYKFDPITLSKPLLSIRLITGGELKKHGEFQVETGQMLFPCVYVKPTCKDTLQFELTRSLFALPLSCEWMGPDLLTNFYPECPPCLSVQVNDSASWLALPEHSFQAAFINAADKGKQMHSNGITSK